MPELVEIKGVGPSLAIAFAKKGYRSVKKIAGARTVDLTAVPGVGKVRAKMLIDAAHSLLKNGTVSSGTLIELKAGSGSKKKNKKDDGKKRNKGKKRKKNGGKTKKRTKKKNGRKSK